MMPLVNFQDGASIGKIGSESGVIIQDSEHHLGARITLERDGETAPYSITCGIYGGMVHTCFFSMESEALQQFDLMADRIDFIFQTSTTDNDFIEAVRKFVKEFP